MAEVCRKYDLTVLPLQVLWIAATFKAITTQILVEEIENISPEYARTTLFRLKEAGYLNMKGNGVYTPTKKCRSIISELTDPRL